jgi:hypothetical protein
MGTYATLALVVVAWIAVGWYARNWLKAREDAASRDET